MAGREYDLTKPDDVMAAMQYETGADPVRDYRRRQAEAHELAQAMRIVADIRKWVEQDAVARPPRIGHALPRDAIGDKVDGFRAAQEEVSNYAYGHNTWESQEELGDFP